MQNNNIEKTAKSLSHDAKSHLTAICGYLQLLQANVSTPNPNIEKLNDLLNKTLTSCNDLSSLLEMLDNKVSTETSN